MRARAGYRTWAVVLCAALCACGGASRAAQSSGTTAGAPDLAPPTTIVVGTASSIRTGASDRELIVSMGSIPAVADGDPCAASIDIKPYLQPREISLSIVVSSASGADLVPCGLAGNRDVAVELDEPAGGRPVTFNVTGTPQRFVNRAGAEYTECALPSCDPSASISEPGTCANLRQFASLADAPKNFDMVDVRCDGSFAVYGLDFGSGGCAPVDGQAKPCSGKIVHRIYWRATDSGWTIVVWDDNAGCGQVLTAASDFPTALCTDLPRIAKG